MFRTLGILAAFTSLLTACATAPKPITKDEERQAVAKTNAIGFELSPDLLIDPAGPDPDFPRGRNTPVKIGTAAVNADRQDHRQCVSKYRRLKGEAVLLVSELKKLTEKPQ